jgi:hypothetical protein
MSQKVEIKEWPYGSAWGHYHWNGFPGPRENVKAAGTYNWKRVEPMPDRNILRAHN